MLKQIALSFSVATLAGACDILAPADCTMDVKPAILVTVEDSITGLPVSGPVQVIARDGMYADTAEFFNPYDRDPQTMDFNPFRLAEERGGTYEVSVALAEYRVWHASAVKVRNNSCHVETVPLTARMQKV